MHKVLCGFEIKTDHLIAQFEFELTSLEQSSTLDITQRGLPSKERQKDRQTDRDKQKKQRQREE